MTQHCGVPKRAAASGPSGREPEGRGGRWLRGGLLGLALAGRVWAQAEEAPEVRAGEVEEGLELIPEEAIPWQDSTVELPLWMRQEGEEIEAGVRPVNQGGGLFPPALWPLQPEPAAGPLRWGREAGKAGEMAAGAVLGPEWVARYVGKKPERAVVDPQQFLGEVRGGQVESLVQRWLNDQVGFQTTLLVFGPGQVLPEALDLEARRREWFGTAREALLVVYYLEQPERTLAVCGLGAGHGMRAAVAAAAEAAGRVAGGPEQLERFCYKLAVGLHGLSGPAAAEGLVDPGRGWDVEVLGVGSALALGGGALAIGWRRRRRARAGAGPQA